MTNTPSTVPNQEQLPPVQMPASQAIFLKIVWFGLALSVLLMVVGSAIGWFVAEREGLLGGLIGAAIGGLFMSISAISIVLANKAIASPAFVPIFFGTILGSMLVKFVLFLVFVFTLKDAEWLHTRMLFIMIVVGIFASLIMDLIVVLKNKIPATSEVKLY